MIAGVLVLLAVAPLSPADGTDADLLASAEQAFAQGAALRQDAAKARPAFARAAAGYDELWRRGHHSPELALDRANAHRLAGDLPRAIAALHEGLAVARWSRPLQVALEDARSGVSYPLVGDLAAQCRPTPAATVGTRMSPAEAWLAAGVLWLLTWIGIARFAMTRAGWWLAFAGLMLAALALLGGLWWQDDRQRRREAAEPLVIVTQDATLRRGNAEGYPARLDAKLPRGVEARALTRRGGWVQVRLAGGAIGWLPATATLKVDD
jgi:hypothetical protein